MEKTQETIRTHQVRNVMMNELGLSREFIRIVAEDLIRQEVEKIMGKSYSSEKIEYKIKKEVQESIASKRDSINKLIQSEVREFVQEEVKKRLRIDISTSN